MTRTAVPPNPWIPAAALVLFAGCATTSDPPYAYRQVGGAPQPATSDEAPPSVVSLPQSTVLERLHNTQQEMAAVIQERDEAVIELATLNQTMAQLKQDNSSLEQLVSSFQNSQQAAQNEVTALEEKAAGLELQLRQQLDQVLTERIQRVRVERELILAKIAEAERIDDG